MNSSRAADLLLSFPFLSFRPPRRVAFHLNILISKSLLWSTLNHHVIPSPSPHFLRSFYCFSRFFKNNSNNNRNFVKAQLYKLRRTRSCWLFKAQHSTETDGRTDRSTCVRECVCKESCRWWWEKAREEGETRESWRRRAAQGETSTCGERAIVTRSRMYRLAVLFSSFILLMMISFIDILRWKGGIRIYVN